MDENLESRSNPKTSQTAMQVYLDERQCDVSAESVGEAIVAAASIANDDGRMIVDVEVDGRRWSEQDLNSPDRANAIADVVRLTSADPVELVSTTFADAAQALDEADDLQKQAAEFIQLDQQRKAMEKLGEALSIWIAVQQAVEKGASLLNVDLNTISIDEKSAQHAVDRLAEQLTVVKDAVETDNPIELSDSLLYELPDVVDQWRALLRELRFRVRGESN